MHFLPGCLQQGQQQATGQEVHLLLRQLWHLLHFLPGCLLLSLLLLLLLLLYLLLLLLYLLLLLLLLPLLLPLLPLLLLLLLPLLLLLLLLQWLQARVVVPPLPRCLFGRSTAGIEWRGIVQLLGLRREASLERGAVAGARSRRR